MGKPDVIAALATAPGRAAIGIVRLSGASLGALMEQLLGQAPPPRKGVLTDFLSEEGLAIDSGIALYFPGPNSYTGEDVLELQGHGGATVLQMVLRRCLNLGARLAEPGEFSRRAFLNGKLDLAQAESVADLIDATSEAAAVAALRSLRGEFSLKIKEIVSNLTKLRVHVEGCIDFPEEDAEFLPEGQFQSHLASLREQLGVVLRTATLGNRLREGVHAVLLGQPNVGKSSLLNCLAGDALAIVTEIPGTTRDTVAADLIFEGVPIHVTDTAGLRETQDPVEKLGVERAWQAAERAEVALLVVDARSGLSAADDEILRKLPSQATKIIVVNKIDLTGRTSGRAAGNGHPEVAVCAKSGEGIDLLRQVILEVTGGLQIPEGTFIARERHLQALRAAVGFLEHGTKHSNQVDLLAEDLRLAQRSLGAIVGDVTADQLLGEIFSRFCIGK